MWIVLRFVPHLLLFPSRKPLVPFNNRPSFANWNHSLGNAAIFLIGGATREIDPVPILLRSGDVIIMSGPACRRAYHGVPRILEGTLPHHLRSQGLDGETFRREWEPYE